MEPPNSLNYWTQPSNRTELKIATKLHTELTPIPKIERNNPINLLKVNKTQQHHQQPLQLPSELSRHRRISTASSAAATELETSSPEVASVQGRDLSMKSTTTIFLLRFHLRCISSECVARRRHCRPRDVATSLAETRRSCRRKCLRLRTIRPTSMYRIRFPVLRTRCKIFTCGEQVVQVPANTKWVGLGVS